MKRIKPMGFVIAMALTLTALLGAGSASASQFRAEEYPTSVSGAQGVQQKLTISPGWNITCTTVTASGSLSAATSTLTLTPAYSGCTVYGISGTATVNSCKYVLHSTNEAPPYTGTVDIDCNSAEEGIEFKQPAVPSCTVKLPEQSALGAVSLANTGSSGSGRTITATFNITGLKAIDSAGCFPGAGTRENGTLTGTSVLKGSNVAGAIGVYIANQQVEPPSFGFEGEEYSTVVNTEPTGNALTFIFPGATPGFHCNDFKANGKLDAFGSLNLNILNWAGCYLFGEFSVKISQCIWGLKETASKSGMMGIACSQGSAATFTALGCSVSIPSQASRTAVNFKNEGSGATREVLATFNVTNLKFTAGAGCPEPGTRENGTIFGARRLKGYQDKGFVPTEQGPLYDLTGPRRGIWVK